MRKVKINHDKTADDYGQLEDAELRIEINCPIVSRHDNAVPCHIGCAWFHIRYIYEGGAKATRHYNCGDKLIGEVVDGSVKEELPNCVDCSYGSSRTSKCKQIIADGKCPC